MIEVERIMKKGIVEYVEWLLKQICSNLEPGIRELLSKIMKLLKYI